MEHWVRAVLSDAFGQQADRITDQMRRDLFRIVELIETQPTFTYRKPALDQISEDIAECADLNALSQLMWSAAIECGFEHCTVFLLRQGNGLAFRTRVCTSYSYAWMERYQEMSYQFVDPVLSAAYVNDLPFRFSDLPSEAPAVRAFWKDAAEHGVGSDGLCGAFDLPGGTRVGVSFATRKTGAALERTIQYNQYDAMKIAQIGSEAFAYLARQQGTPDAQLSSDELRFLHVLVTSDDPHEALRILPQFGSNISIQASIRRKLGVQSIVQAVAVASANRWFDTLPYDVREVTRAFPELAGWDVLTARPSSEDELVESGATRPSGS